MIVLGMFNFNRKQVVHVLNNYDIKVTIFDPLANTEEVMHEYGLECHSELGIVNPRPQSGVEGLGDRTLTATSLRASESERSNHINTAHTKNPTVNPRSLSGVEGRGNRTLTATSLRASESERSNHINTAHTKNPTVNPRSQSGVEGLGDRTLTATSLRASESERSNHINTAHTKNPTVNPRPQSGVEGLGGEEFYAIVLGVAHKQFLNMDLDPLKKEIAVVYDVKGVLEQADGKL